jgi:hypothetical protein
MTSGAQTIGFILHQIGFQKIADVLKMGRDLLEKRSRRFEICGNILLEIPGSLKIVLVDPHARAGQQPRKHRSEPVEEAINPVPVVAVSVADKDVVIEAGNERHTEDSVYLNAGEDPARVNLLNRQNLGKPIGWWGFFHILKAQRLLLAMPNQGAVRRTDQPHRISKALEIETGKVG